MTLQGNIFDYVIVYWSGVVVSFTPCVYPVVPLVASFIGGVNTRGTRTMGFVISLIYVLGLAVTYSLLGVAAALSGKVFGQFQNSPVVSIVVANVLLFFALVMLDVLPWPLPSVNLQGRIKRRGLWSVFLVGAASGLLVGPCTAPVLGTVLLYVGSRRNLLHAASLLFVFSYGVGTSLILAGTFSGFLSRMPKSGVWLKRIKQFCALVLIVLAEYFLVKAGQRMF